ncbi:hypothetical protein [Streptomyces sp. NPDC000931]|uniref:hypothetical protein n=1 Tax=Streptomyces sp. NPDC000931 TaxID=3154372 RepID=UPI0033189DC4
MVPLFTRISPVLRRRRYVASWSGSVLYGSLSRHAAAVVTSTVTSARSSSRNAEVSRIVASARRHPAGRCRARSRKPTLEHVALELFKTQRFERAPVVRAGRAARSDRALLLPLLPQQAGGSSPGLPPGAVGICRLFGIRLSSKPGVPAPQTP